MPRATRSTPANRSPTRAAPAQQPPEAPSSSSNSPKKRARPDASLDMPDALEAMEHRDSEGRVASAPRKTRRTGKAKEGSESNVEQSGGGESGKAATGENGSPLHETRSSAAMVTDDEPAVPGGDASQASSSTLEQAHDGQVIFDGSGMSAEQRRKAKGKGKAVEQEEVKMEDAGEDDELTRLRKELAVSKELMAQQQAALASVHSAIACAICTEPLDRPYSLQCGHVFCRKCLVTWFFRADPDEEDRQNAAAEQATGSSSSSSSSSDEDDASSSSGSIHSHMGGHINGRAFNITNLGDDDERKQRIFDATNEALLKYGFDLPPDVVRRSLAGGRRAADDESDGGRIVELEEDGKEKDEGEEEKQLTRDELRQKRLAALARFGLKVGGAGDPAALTSSGRFEEVKDEEKGDEQPVAGPSTARPAAATTNASASTSAPRRPETASAGAPPAPPKSPLKPRPPPPPVPVGAHRAKNLVCPSCRAICSEHSPNRVFVLDEIVTSIRRSNVDESGAVGSSAGAWRARTETAEDGWPAMDEADESWGGLFPGPGGKESASDRRRRLAQIVRDRDDGVRRCGECNWELDERTGICEGCGRRWDISDDDSDDTDDTDDSTDDHTFGGLLGFGRHRLGRQHHDVELSGSDDDSDDGSQPARAALYDSQESYESDFVVKSDEEEEQERERTEARLRRRREAVRRRQRRLEASDSESRGSGSSGSSSASKSGSDLSEEDNDTDDERDARRRRRARRQQGERIDLGSDTDSDEDGSQGSSNGSGDASSGSGSDSGGGSERGGGRGFLDDEASVKRSKKKRIIIDSDSEDDE
ncbi:RHTO0S05e02586g1_1 [Rhodotorula toruloides]|uniref:RHTO0S05e02586g1_1 n=1 Tax=Rhodotorula toruloides TaxID=5286 RepID=A0A061AYA6_RHOTO|nr:hypothetical protein OF846_002842 [Rhodotorula toruloides]CDR40374.1 RHTO0S05e02586g1_1 [Rhodotorula toruloides]